jgi:hypothetical protein
MRINDSTSQRDAAEQRRRRKLWCLSRLELTNHRQSTGKEIGTLTFSAQHMRAFRLARFHLRRPRPKLYRTLLLHRRAAHA